MKKKMPVYFVSCRKNSKKLLKIFTNALPRNRTAASHMTVQYPNHYTMATYWKLHTQTLYLKLRQNFVIIQFFKFLNMM